jgi:DNA-directed RNA polymerase specialized sigma24 family protein
MNDEQIRTRFETLILPLMKDAYNLSRWLMKNQEDAEDADLVRLLEHGLQIVEEAISAFKTYTPILRNKHKARPV